MKQKLQWLGWLVAAISFLLSATILFFCGSKELAFLQLLVAVLCAGLFWLMQNRGGTDGDR